MVPMMSIRKVIRQILQADFVVSRYERKPLAVAVRLVAASVTVRRAHAIGRTACCRQETDKARDPTECFQRANCTRKYARRRPADTARIVRAPRLIARSRCS